jgi:hypothetical protein
LFTTSDLEKKSDIIHISFHVQEFNPYTNTEITVVLHQRLFNAYKDKIFPFIIEDLLKHSSSIDCYTFSKKHNNIIELQEFMLTTTEEKLREINKKLRNKDDVKIILEKTGLTFN